ncbi:MAG: DinB family protein, partial [Paenisporosarcina sp.]
NDSTFENNDGLSWEQTVELTNQILSEWTIAIDECGEEKIQKWSSDLTYLTLHNAYHIGQIVHIRKQKEIWNPKQGVH